MPSTQTLTDKPWLGLNDLHLIGKVLLSAAAGHLTLPAQAEHTGLDTTIRTLDRYLTRSIGADWPEQEALV
jgi:hypothetical protein